MAEEQRLPHGRGGQLRFLREYFGEDDIVRRKLNESYEAYGIHRGSFDDIQMSLTDPAHALRIREATEFFDQNADVIRDAIQQNDHVRCLLAVIDSRIDKIRVGSGRYAKALINERRRHLNDAVVQGGLMRALYAFQEWGSRAVSSLSTMPGHIPKLPGIIQCQLREMIQPGDVFITRKDSAVTNYFLPGYWPHAALHIGDEHVIESLKDGVRLRTLTSPFGNDAIALIRPKLGETSICESIDRARSHVGKPYDFDFDFTRSDRIVCTEVVYRSYEGIDEIHFTLTSRAGRPTLSAEDLLNLALKQQFFDLIAVYCQPHSEQLMTDERKVETLRQTMAEPAI